MHTTNQIVAKLEEALGMTAPKYGNGSRALTAEEQLDAMITIAGRWKDEAQNALFRLSEIGDRSV